MIKSMTGFGRAEYSDSKRNITVEIRSVNHRYCDVSVKMPRRYSFAEEPIKKTIKEVIKRGKLDVSVMVEDLAEGDLTVKLNPLMAKQYVESLTALKEQFGLNGEITLEYLASLPDVMKAIPDVEDEAEITRSILVPTLEAAKNLDAMRQVEGDKLATDLLSRGETIRTLLGTIETRAELVPQEYMEKMKARIADLLKGSVNIPEERILTEAAIFADKCSIAEEITRLYSHMDQMKTIIDDTGEPQGKKLDFLVQEMNREANTIGSKANDIAITENMLKIKSEVEKIREQVQNVE